MRLLHITQFTLAAIVATSPVAYGALLEGGAVAAPDEYSAKVAAQVLKNGGNAVDAAIAAAAAMTIVEPVSNGLGSDAFCILWDGKELHGLNASGRAPQG